MTDPQRAERHWLAIAIATLWVVSVGGESDADLSFNDSQQLPATPVESQNSDTGTPKPRVLSCFRRGLLLIQAALLNHLPLPIGQFFPDFSPSIPFLSSALYLKNLPLKAQTPSPVNQVKRSHNR
ncbi:MAG: hypothetical protein F6K56_39800 [Moorea sp. SIO3G5]|nr:hypothetical protein [Moorena sp. SIO3G5]